MRTMMLIPVLMLALLPLGLAQNANEKNRDTRANAPMSSSETSRITREVHHQLVLLPWYGVFDNLAYKVDPNGTVTLLGQVRQATLKKDAENAIKHIEGVEHVDNQIKILPTSTMDDQIRLRTFHAIYGNGTLSRYAVLAVPSIHIIVDNGHVTLVGVVDSQTDKQVAGVQANGVPGVFSVNNDLKVEDGQGENESQKKETEANNRSR
jgi:BON domain-containing protein